MTETQFADDVALYSSSRSDFEMVARTFVDMAKQRGLTVSTQKTMQRNSSGGSGM